MIFLFTVNIASALALYWLTSGIVAIVQQYIALSEDADEMSLGDTAAKAGATAKAGGKIEVIEGEVVETSKQKASAKSKKKTGKGKRRKK
jgi:membrane protein insertase Oxa1/YidC/SpoIIIJ